MEKERRTVAVVGNPTSDKGKAGETYTHVHAMLLEAGNEHGFEVVDLTGENYGDSLQKVRDAIDDLDYVIVVGGDGMVSLGVNALGHSGKPLGIVAIGSGNDFARSMGLPIDRVQIAVEGIIGAIVRGSHIEVDMGHVTSLASAVRQDAHVNPEQAENLHESVSHEANAQEDQPDSMKVDKYYAGMLSCGMDASVNNRANHSRLPNGTLRYFAALMTELTRLKPYGYHLCAVLEDGSVDERDVLSPLLTVANSRYVGGGIFMSPQSQLDDGLLDVIWLEGMPSLAQCITAVANAYNGKILDQPIFHTQRVKSIEISHYAEGAEPPALMADGEYVGQLPVKVTAQEHSLQVLVPPAVAEYHGMEKSYEGESR